jgi:hypothetical protein
MSLRILVFIVKLRAPNPMIVLRFIFVPLYEILGLLQSGTVIRNLLIPSPRVRVEPLAILLCIGEIRVRT